MKNWNYKKVSVDQSPSKTGGLMGLCMGMSFVSVAEIIYYCARVRFLTKCSSFIHCNKRLMAAECWVLGDEHFPSFHFLFRLLAGYADLVGESPKMRWRRGEQFSRRRWDSFFLQHFGLVCLRMWHRVREADIVLFRCIDIHTFWFHLEHSDEW